jgi:serine/threonine protein kinase
MPSSLVAIYFYFSLSRLYRDIKGGNVLVDTGTVKLADFGASTKMAFGETQSTSTIKGRVLPVCALCIVLCFDDGGGGGVGVICWALSDADCTALCVVTF